MAILPELVFEFNSVPVKIPAGFFLATDKLVQPIQECTESRTINNLAFLRCN